jgi:hypothetical protein
MSSKDAYIVPLRSVQHEAVARTLHLDNEYFADLEQSEIIGGDVKVEMRVRFGAGDTYLFTYKGEGTVVVACDRCLDPTTIPIVFEEELRVGYDDDNADADLIVIPFSQTHYDTAWDIFESIALNLPLQRVHPEGECNADMMSRFSAEEDSEDNSTDFSS